MLEKMRNMKKTWKDAKAMQLQSGGVVKPERNEGSINQVLEWRCYFSCPTPPPSI